MPSCEVASPSSSGGGVKKVIGRRMYLLVPKESGYSYVVCLAFSIILILCFAPSSSFGMLFSSFITDGDIGGLTLVSGISSIVQSLTAVFVSVALKTRLSLRQVALVGAALFTGGWLATAFARSIAQLAVAYSLLQTVGRGVLATVALVSFNEHFVRKRVAWMSWCNVAKNVGAAAFPLWLERATGAYGARGAFLLAAALAAHSFFAALCLHPLEWHAAEAAPLHRVDADGEKRNGTLKCQDDSKGGVSTDEGLWCQFARLLDLSLFTEVVFVNIILAISVTLFSDNSFFAIYPLYLYSMGFDTSDVAQFVAILGASDLLSRLLLAVLCKFYDIKPRSLFFFGMVAITISRIVFIYCSSFWSLMMITFVLGSVRSVFMLHPLIYSEYYPEKFTAAYGLGVLFMGLMSTILMPLLGLLRDTTGNYTIVFYLLACSPVLSIIAWTAEMCAKKLKKQNEECTPLLYRSL